jgi:hypothetical protein
VGIAGARRSRRKYVTSHPAVTVARVGTTEAAHVLDDTGGGIGPLPDGATRKRIAP